MVAPNYAEHRSALAKQAGLGRKPAAAKPAAPELDLTPPPPPPRAAPVPAPAPAMSVAPPQEHPRESRSEHTAASVFAKFPRAQEPVAEAPAAAPADVRKSTRKPFSKQLARTMRP
jgi:hypothetical protein